MDAKRKIELDRRAEARRRRAATRRLINDIRRWDGEAMGWLMHRGGFDYRTAITLCPAWRAIRHEPMDDDQRREYLITVLEFKAYD